MLRFLHPCLTPVVGGDGLIYIPGVTLGHKRGQMLFYQFMANSKQLRNAGPTASHAIATWQAARHAY